LPYGAEFKRTVRGIGLLRENFSMGAIVSNVYKESTIEVAHRIAERIYGGTAEIRLSDTDDLLKYTNVYSDVLIPENGEWKMLWHS
jgi:hypothetical protein